MRKLLVFIIALSLFMSCYKDEVKVKIEDDILINSKIEEFNLDQNLNVVHKYSNFKEREEILEKLCSGFISDVYFNNDFDNNFQMAGAVIEENKLDKTLSIKYDVISLGNMNEMELAYSIIGLGSTKDNELNDSQSNSYYETVQSSKLKHTCSGGKNGGKTLTLDRPTNPFSAASYGRKVSKFAVHCLNVKEGVTVGKVRFLIRKDENQVKDPLYRKLLDSTENILINKLDRIN